MEGQHMYNEKNEMKKVNFGDLPVNWDEEEFAEEITVEGSEGGHSLDTNKAKVSVTRQKSYKQM